MTGFGVVHPLPGIADDVHLNTAITLPIGVEAYAAYAMYVWLSGLAGGGAARFAKWSAIGSLTLGAAGQVAYHLLEAAHVKVAPWPITALVACLPVVVLGMGAALAHMTAHSEPADRTGQGTSDRTSDRAGQDTRPDTAADRTPDTGQDTKADTGQDRTPDIRPDTTPDIGQDIGQDIEADIRPDTGQDNPQVIPMTGRRGRVVAKVIAGQMTQASAAGQLGCSVKTIGRYVATAKRAAEQTEETG